MSSLYWLALFDLRQKEQFQQMNLLYSDNDSLRGEIARLKEESAAAKDTGQRAAASENQISN